MTVVWDVQTGMCVRSSRRKPGNRGGLACPLAGQVDVLDAVVAALLEGRLAQEQVGVLGGFFESAAGIGIAGVGQHRVTAVPSLSGSVTSTRSA